MRKILVLLLCSMLLVGCGGKPSDMSDEIYDKILYEIKAVDAYLDGEASQEETYAKIESVKMPSDTEMEEDEYAKALDWQTSFLTFAIRNNDITEIKEKRNTLAKIIKYKEYK